MSDMLTFEEWRHTYADVFETDDAARAAWTAASNNGYRAGVRDTRELLASHSAGARADITPRFQEIWSDRLRIVPPKRKVTVQLWRTRDGEEVSRVGIGFYANWTLLGEHTFEIDGEL